MKMATLTTSYLCIICGTKVYFGEDTTLINSRREICFKFTSFVSRYLNLESTKEIFNYCNSNFGHVDDTNSTFINRKNSICCFTCLAKVEAFCDTFHKLECVELEIFHILESLSKLMKGTSSGVYNKFQDEFISEVQKQTRRHGPFVRLEKLSESELQLLERSHLTETESSSLLLESEIQCDELEECDLRFSDDDDGVSDGIDDSKFELEQNFENCEEEEPKQNLEEVVSDYPTNPTDIGNYLANMKFENTKPQTEVRLSRNPKPNLPRQCLMCGKIFSCYFRLCNHLRSHIGERVFHCQICLKEFSRNDNFIKHKITHHLNGGVKCNICGKSVENIEVHCMQAHRPVTKVFCEKCGRTFHSGDSLKRHATFCRPGVIRKRKGSNKKRFSVCDICGKTFSFQCNFRRHMLRVHGKKEGVKTYKCPHTPCRQIFYDNYHLVHHIRTHTGERPHQCDQCGSAFTQRASLKIHMDSHSKIKKFTCKICGQGFCHKQSLKNHEKTHLENEELN